MQISSLQTHASHRVEARTAGTRLTSPATPSRVLVAAQQQPSTDLPTSASQIVQAESRRSHLLKGLAFVGLTVAAPVLGLQLQQAEALETPELGELANQIAIDFTKNQYYVTGNLTESLYDENCTFKDPTTTVQGPKKYTDALKTLFNPSKSKAELISLKVDSPCIILKWRLEGTLNFGNLAIKPYTGTTTYRVDSSSGKIKEHSETWDISTLDAFISPFFPNFGAPPAPPAEKIRADLIRNSFTAAGKPVPAGLKL